MDHKPFSVKQFQAKNRVRGFINLILEVVYTLKRSFCQAYDESLVFDDGWKATFFRAAGGKTGIPKVPGGKAEIPRSAGR